jgi:glycosyltransferase involved in cell wall biosynthesis
MNILFISRVKYGTMGSGALNWYPKYVSLAGHAVQIVECLREDFSEATIDSPSYVAETNTVQSDNLFDHLNLIFKIANNFLPDVLYIFGRKDLYDFVYHLRHRFPKSKIVVDVRSPLLIESPAEKRAIEEDFYRLQYYIDHINTCELESLKTYTSNIFKPVGIVPIGVDCSSIAPEASINKGSPLNKFVFVGSIYRKRRINVLVDNFIFFAESTNWNVSLDIYGTGDSVEHIEKLIKSKSRNNAVNLMGALSQKELFKILPKYDAGIAYVPHELYSMAPSLKSLEYAASGIAILASDTVGHNRYCRDHGFSFNFFSNNKNDFIKTFKAAHVSGVPQEEINSNLEAVKFFDWKRIVEERLLPTLTKLVY